MQYKVEILATLATQQLNQQNLGVPGLYWNDDNEYMGDDNFVDPWMVNDLKILPQIAEISKHREEGPTAYGYLYFGW